MLNYLNQESSEKKDAVLMAPVYITLYAANADGVFKEDELEAAVDFVHVQTYNGPEFLQEYFTLVKKDFTEHVTRLNKELPHGKEERDNKLKELLSPTREFMQRLDEEEYAIFKRELLEFVTLIEKSNRSILEAAILPLFSGFLHKTTNLDAGDLL